MFSYLRAIFRQQWRLNKEKSQGFHSYYESPVTGDRKVRTSTIAVINSGSKRPAILYSGHQPIDRHWLKSSKSGRYFIDGKEHHTETDFDPQAPRALPKATRSCVKPPENN